MLQPTYSGYRLSRLVCLSVGSPSCQHIPSSTHSLPDSSLNPNGVLLCFRSCLSCDPRPSYHNSPGWPIFAFLLVRDRILLNPILPSCPISSKSRTLIDSVSIISAFASSRCVSSIVTPTISLLSPYFSYDLYLMLWRCSSSFASRHLCYVLWVSC